MFYLIENKTRKIECKMIVANLFPMFNHPPRKCNGYKLINCIISTNNSCVYESIHIKQDKKVILKFIPIFEENSERVQNEYRIQSLAHHPFIMSVSKWDFSFKKDNYLVLEMAPAKCSLDSVHEFIHTEKAMYKIMYQALLAIDYLHNSRILHDDIKPQNFVLMDANELNPEIRVIDFGHSYHFTEEKEENCFINISSGTLAFNSPELLSYSPHSFPSDIWSLGATFYFLITGNNILVSSTKIIMYEEASRLFLPYDNKFGPYFPESGRKLISSMLSFKPEERPTAKKCLESIFFIDNLDNDWIQQQHVLINQMINDNRITPDIVDITDEVD